MKPTDLDKPFVPVLYALLILEVAEKLGVARADLLAAAELDPQLLEKADGRLPSQQIGGLLYRAAELSGEPGFGYEIGLNSHLTYHGIMGYGLISSSTVREAIELGATFLQLRLPSLQLRLFTEGDQAVIETVETIELGPVRQLMFDLFLVGLARLAPALLGGPAPAELELRFDYPQPPYYRRYARQLPPVSFDSGANQLRFPAAYLELRPDTANPVTARLVAEQCQQELEQLGLSGDLPQQLRALLRPAKGRYPDLKTAAERLCMSTRTLKRKLAQHGLSYQQLLDESRHRDSMRLLRESQLSIEKIANRVGYTDPANFTRAFKRWSGRSPSAFREALGEAEPRETTAK